MAKSLPQPGTDKILIEWKEPKEYHYRLTGLLGKTIASGSSHGSMELDVTGLEDGIYILTILAEGHEASLRLIKE